MIDLPNVKNEVEIQIMNHLFCLRRLRWQDMTPVNEWIVKHKMVDRLAITAHALYKISGRTVTPEEAVKVLTSIPRGALEPTSVI